MNEDARLGWAIAGWFAVSTMALAVLGIENVGLALCLGFFGCVAGYWLAGQEDDSEPPSDRYNEPPDYGGGGY